MAGIYNRFQIRPEKKELIKQVKVIAQKVICEHNYRFCDWLVWETIEESETSIEAENYLDFDYTDLEKSKELFSQICKTIIQELPNNCFMGNYCFDYSNVDHADYLFAFYKNGVLAFYEGGTNDGEGYLLSRSVCSLENGKLSNPKTLELDQDDSNEGEFDEEERHEVSFSEIWEDYENGVFPDLMDEEAPKPSKIIVPLQEDREEKVGKYKLIIGRFYQIEYSEYGKSKELIGKLESYYAKTYELNYLGGNTFERGYIEERNIKSVTEVLETSDTHRIKKEHDQTTQEIAKGEKELSALRSSFYTEYLKNKSKWEHRPLKLSKIKTGFEKIEIGKTYLVTVKKGFSVAGKDAVLVVDCTKDAIGEMLRCLTCDPNVSKADITMIRPVIASNLSELSHELFVDEKASEIQQQRISLYNKVNDLYGERRKLTEEYRASFSRA